MRKFIHLLFLALLAGFQSFAQPCNDAVVASITSTAICSAPRNIDLAATTIPGATYTWTSVPGTYTFNNPNLQNPQVVNPVASPLTAILFIVTATVGPCTYKDTVGTIIEVTPFISNVTSNSPVCTGDSIHLVSFGSGIQGALYHWYGPNSWLGPGDPANWVSKYGVTQTIDQGTYCNYIEVPTTGCISDTFCIPVQVAPLVDAAFSYTLHESCGRDTVRFTNLSQNNTVNTWTLGDGSPNSSAHSPSHIYNNPTGVGTYTVRLFVSDGGKCTDSAFQTININHPIDASFGVSNDSFCQGETIQFDATATIVNPYRRSYFWSFGDGLTDTVHNPLHHYPYTGEYNVQFIVRDSTIRCFVGDLDSIPGLDTLFWSDTAYYTIVVDSISYIFLSLSDTVICAGQAVTLTGDFSAIGNTGFQWTFGDGNVRSDLNPIDHAYTNAGDYTIRLDAYYRICPDTFIEKKVVVKPFPTINLGPDTVLCPEGAPIPLIDALNAGNPDAKWLWNTGDTTSTILVKNTGVYSATVVVNGCSETDSVTIGKNCYIDIPNVFSPNGDGSNDYFLPRQFLSRNVSAFNMQIFSRWGQKIYETKAIDGRGWDGMFNGEHQPTGVYVYLVEVTFANGARESYKGNVTLLR